MLRCLILASLGALAGCVAEPRYYAPASDPGIEAECQYDASKAVAGISDPLDNAWTKSDLLAQCRKAKDLQ